MEMGFRKCAILRVYVLFPLSAVLLLLLLLLESSADLYSAGYSRYGRHVIVPHDCRAGYVVASLPFVGQSYSLEATPPSTGLDVAYNNGSFRDRFAVLDNGDVVIVADISCLLGQFLKLIVINQLELSAWTDQLVVEVADGRRLLRFSQPVYEGSVAENLPAFSFVRNLNDVRAVIAGDAAAFVWYAIVAGPYDLFEIYQDERHNVIVRTLTTFDHEQETQYMISIMARTGNLTDEPATAKVWIAVDNTNDNFPRMEATVYEGEVDGETSRDSEIVTVKAFDADDDDEMVYFLTGAGSEEFGIHAKNGSIFTRKPGRDLQTSEYNLKVYAEDGGCKQSEPADVHITVESSRWSTPGVPASKSGRNKRALEEKTFVIPETMVHKLIDLNKNSQDVQGLFAFKEPGPKRLEIDPVAGSVWLKSGEKLDYETERELDFIVQITRPGDPSYLEEQPVRIRLKDVNDEIPEFRNIPRPFLTTVSASAPSGTSVYQLMAQDADEDSAVRYILESGGEDRFDVDTESGVVRTKGSQPLPHGKEFEIGISAQDVSAKTMQKSPTHSLKILVGDRDPQFYETQYIANIPETASEQFKILEVKAFSHQGYPLTYELTTESGSQSNEFAIDQSTGVVDLLRSLDYEKDPQQYHLRVKVIENGRPTRTSTVNLIINLVDMNDNAPTFPLSQYIVQGIAETVAMGTDIIQVTATDLDSVTNSQLTYSVNDDSFTVQTLNNIGYIKTAKRLDYDNILDHTYNFTIVASDNGSPSHRGSAMVRVSVTNVNDEDPVFMQPVEHVQVSEDAPSNTVVHVVQAYDPDGDSVSYTFSGGWLTEGPFSIDPKSGIITLVGSLDKVRVSYRLNITAVDNGGCCGGTTSRRSNGIVVIEIKDINNNAPRFIDCANYNPVVMEKENVGTFVIQVKAVDLDTGPNGNVTYSLVKSNDQSSDRFDIDAISGFIRTADVFDREAQIGVTDYGITVKAEDQGSQTLAGFCTFRVKIGDKNDNPPVFNLPLYATSIEERSMVGKRVKQVYATDRDAGDNGKVEYFMRRDPSEFFAINQYNGWVTVAKPMSGRDQVQLEIEARDKGDPVKSSYVTMDIEITQTINAYPQWVDDYSLVPTRVSENAPVNTIVKRLKATSSIPDSLVHYVIQPGEAPEQNGQPRSFYQRIDEKTNEMILLTYKPLDYENLPQYILTIKAANRATNSLHNDTRLVIDLIDENDEIPQFIGLDENGRYPGSVAENLDPEAEVITVTATDKDEFEDFRKIHYRIKEVGVDHNKFTIDRHTGIIRSKASFDRELKNEYYITVIAEDGAPSDRPNHYPAGTPNQGEAEVQVRVTDMNDNTPFFKDRLYTARVPENTDPGTVIITVIAEDKDEENRLTYSITGGNHGNAFEVVSDLGEIKVRGHLDYENGPREYRLTYRVFDDKYANTTTILVQVLDVNDNPPRFDNAIYNVTDIEEELQGISKNNPRYLLGVRATDPDVDRKSVIRYSLTGQFVDDGTFVINDHTGEISLTRSLDRDQSRGRPVWNFNVLAHDEPDSNQPSLTGYAEVRVMPKDINDNAPVFDRNRLIGKIPEHSRSGMTVLTVIATDADNGNNGSVTYSLKQVPMKGNQPLFSIDSHMGLISTMVNNALDRESQSEYYIIVQAKDRGSPPMSSSATVTILIDDINDHAPHFTKSIYHTTMSENFAKGASITSVSATDLDIGHNAKLTYTLKEQDREYFYISSIEATNTGVLKVFKPVDYDSVFNAFFNVTVYVQDTEPSHVDTAYIEVTVTDYNDNPPVFLPNTKKVAIFENVTVGTTLHKFSATDKDTGINKQFVYAIDRYTDPERQFAIDGNGLVTTARLLDRETIPGHRVHILAIDKGTPPQTGTGILIVSLSDVNDNFPEFAQDYRPVVYENQPPGLTVVHVSAVDRDIMSNGPSFEFWLPCGGACPCPSNPVCNDFAFKFLPGGGDNGYGSGIVTSLRTFDREKKKEYYLPIIMKDSGQPPISGTNTLTIVIGDVNDNRHDPGHKDIFVYSYRGWKGAFDNVPLGNVYAEDPDDWDVVNKTFHFHQSKDMERFFRLDRATGQLYINGTLMSGSYRFKVRVYDVVMRREVISSVAVTVKDITDEAIVNSGSLRIHGTTAEDFVGRPKVGPSPTDYGLSRYAILQIELAKKLNVPLENVDIFTVMNHPTLVKTVDIRYSAHGSPYYRPARLDGILLNNKKEFEAVLGLTIVMVPVDECLLEKCESGGCTNRLITSAEPLLINTNGTSITGILSYVQAECQCAARTFTTDDSDIECHSNTCINGGTCIQKASGVSCLCPVGFDGPRCQQTHHSFNGDGWAWYEPLAQCEDSHTSLEFITSRENGLILYNGPMKDLADGDPEDFIILEMKHGYPLLRINHGSGETKLSIDGRDTNRQQRLGKLNDGHWHRVDVIRNGKHVRLVVDQCRVAGMVESDGIQPPTEDRRACEAASETPGENKYINVNTPLQVGGRSNPRVRFPQNVMRDGFTGCIKNLIHDGKLYDLHIGRVGEHFASEDGCPREELSCGSPLSPSSLKCGHNGLCIGNFHSRHRCICLPGWRGGRCNISTTEKDFRARSFIEWDFQDQYYAHLDRHGAHETELQLMFRTRREAGLLFKAQNAQKSEYLVLEVYGYRVRFRYNLGSAEKHLTLSHVNASDGAWHTARVRRIGHWVEMKLDGGEGRLFNESFGNAEDHLEIHISQRSLFAGGAVRFPSSNSPPLVDHDFENGCMTDIRFNGEWFPMDEFENRESRAAHFLTRSQNVEDGCPSDVCTSNAGFTQCPHGLECIDLWRHAECRCPVGKRLSYRNDSDDPCMNVDECLETPNVCNYGTCRDTDDSYTCECHSGYSGPLCAERREATSVFVTTGAILAIIVCGFVVLLLVLIFVMYSRRHRTESYAAGVDPNDDVRENIIHYDEEGVGEEDQDAYDINKLKKPIGNHNNIYVSNTNKPKTSEAGTLPRRRAPSLGDLDVGEFIKTRLWEANNDASVPPFDSVREYAYEGGGSPAGSLSSLASTATGESDEEDWDHLSNWGPRFQRLADLYNEIDA